MTPARRILPALCRIALVLLSLHIGGAHAQAEITLATRGDTEFAVRVFPADGDYLLLWIAPEYGFREPHRELARQLPEQGIEVWQTNIAESLFLPDSTETLRGLDGRHVADLVERAHRDTGKKIALAGDAYAALPVLHGAREWQLRGAGTAYLVGAVLFTPYTFASTPPLGAAPEYMPIVDASNIPMLVFLAQNSPGRPQFETLGKRLGANGNPVYRYPMPGIMSLFYEQPSSAAMQRQAQQVPQRLRQMLPLLARHPVPAAVLPMRAATASGDGIDIYLREFSEPIRPGRLDLDDVDGKRYTREDFSGQVTLVNFWASWCPPCVEEIPSLNRLQQVMKGRPFELVSINYAEQRDTVIEFMQRVAVEFPVLLDSDGRYAREWKVISYPSTYVIDRDGVIRYGVNAAIEWDDPALVRKLEALLR